MDCFRVFIYWSLNNGFSLLFSWKAQNNFGGNHEEIVRTRTCFCTIRFEASCVHPCGFCADQRHLLHRDCEVEVQAYGDWSQQAFQKAPWNCAKPRKGLHQHDSREHLMSHCLCMDAHCLGRWY